MAAEIFRRANDGKRITFVFLGMHPAHHRRMVQLVERHGGRTRELSATTCVGFSSVGAELTLDERLVTIILDENFIHESINRGECLAPEDYLLFDLRHPLYVEILNEHIYGRRLEGAVLPRSPMHGSVGSLAAPPERNEIPRSASHLDVPRGCFQGRQAPAAPPVPAPAPAAPPVPAPAPVAPPVPAPAPAAPPVPAPAPVAPPVPAPAPVAESRRHNQPYTFIEMDLMLQYILANDLCRFIYSKLPYEMMLKAGVIVDRDPAAMYLKMRKMLANRQKLKSDHGLTDLQVDKLVAGPNQAKK